jgi:hypothetical protein
MHSSIAGEAIGPQVAGNVIPINPIPWQLENAGYNPSRDAPAGGVVARALEAIGDERGDGAAQAAGHAIRRACIMADGLR